MSYFTTVKDITVMNKNKSIYSCNLYFSFIKLLSYLNLHHSFDKYDNTEYIHSTIITEDGFKKVILPLRISNFVDLLKNYTFNIDKNLYDDSYNDFIILNIQSNNNNLGEILCKYTDSSINISINNILLFNNFYINDDDDITITYFDQTLNIINVIEKKYSDIKEHNVNDLYKKDIIKKMNI